MLVYLIQQDKGFRAVVVLVVHVTPEGLAEGVRGEVADLQAVLSFDAFQFSVDKLDGYWLILSVGRFEYELVFVWLSQQLVQVAEGFANGRIESDGACFPSLLFRHDKLIPVQNVLPAEIKNVSGAAGGAELQACEQFDAVFAVFMESVNKVLIFNVSKYVSGS